MTEDEMVGQHHQPNGHEFEQVPGDGDSGSVPVPSQSIKDPRDLVKTNPQYYNLRKILSSWM